jgi:hypothetical protein
MGEDHVHLELDRETAPTLNCFRRLRHTPGWTSTDLRGRADGDVAALAEVAEAQLLIL